MTSAAGLREFEEMDGTVKELKRSESQLRLTNPFLWSHGFLIA